MKPDTGRAERRGPNRLFNSARLLGLPLSGIIAAAILISFYRTAEAQPQPRSLVILNGKSAPVYYNDGDTFRILAGPLSGSAARLGGFNTLESYGPVHQWKGFTFKELYVNAKQATLHARRGVWHCSADANSRDAYGRLLAECEDLQESHIRRGLAHALNIEGPSPKRLIEAQRYAIVNRQGMWAKGVPAQVLTSLHSVDERPDNAGNYNRLVSPIDGVSTKWMHQEHYEECQQVCHPTLELSREGALRVIKRLRQDPHTEPAVRGLEDVYLMVLLNEYVTMNRVPEVFSKPQIKTIKKLLDALKSEGVMGELEPTPGACMTYVKFERRYRYKPDCLKW